MFTSLRFLSYPYHTNKKKFEMSVSRCCPRALGTAILHRHQSLLEQDLGVSRVHTAHALVRECLQSVAPELHLYTFGSASVYGFHEPKSDVDFVTLRDEDIQEGKGQDSSSQLAKALQTEILGKLSRSMRTKNFSWSIEEVKRARVPVVKVKTPTLDFDVTAYRRNGVRNSALLRAYFDQDPMNRWLSIAVKDWSKRTGMNGPFGYLTSYGFNLLVVFYLLHGSGGRSFLGQGRGVGCLSFVDRDVCDVAHIPTIPSYQPLVAPRDPELLGAQVIDFLDFYLQRFPMDTHVVTLNRDEPVTKVTLNWTKSAEDLKNMAHEKVSYRVCIEDPYEVNLNVGRNITSFKSDMMRKHFENGLRTGLGLLQ